MPDVERLKHLVYRERERSAVPLLASEVYRRDDWKALLELLHECIDRDYDDQLQLTVQNLDELRTVNYKKCLRELRGLSTLKLVSPVVCDLSWNPSKAKLFAADCAEHVVHIYEDVHHSPQARTFIEAARKQAQGEAVEVEEIHILLPTLPKDPLSAAKAWLSAYSTNCGEGFLGMTLRHAWSSVRRSVEKAEGNQRVAEEKRWQAKLMLSYALP